MLDVLHDCQIFFFTFRHSDPPDENVLNDLIRSSHQLGLEIVSASAHSVHVYTDAHDDAATLERIGLKRCVRLAELQELFKQELKQNWHKLSDTTGESFRGSLLEEIEEQPLRIERRSTDDKECVLDGKCDGGEDHWFTEYVSLACQLRYCVGNLFVAASIFTFKEPRTQYYNTHS